MLIEFSNDIAVLLQAQPYIRNLDWLNENKLDLASIKQLKGCRTELVQNCLIFIQKLDASATMDSFNSSEKKNYATQTSKELLEDLKKYKESSERYPRIKNFLNIIPDDIGSIVMFILVISLFISSAYLPLAIAPAFIISWIGMDLFFNNRETAKNLKKQLSLHKENLRKIEEVDDILKPKWHTPSPGPIQAEISPLAVPSTSYATFYRSAENLSEASGINATSNFTY